MDWSGELEDILCSWSVYKTGDSRWIFDMKFLQLVSVPSLTP